MKKLSVTIQVELEIPDEWSVRKTSEGTDVLDIGEGRYMDLTFEPLLSTDLDGIWSDSADEDFLNELLDMTTSEQVTYKISTVH